MTADRDVPVEVPDKIVIALDRIGRGVRSHRQRVASDVGLSPLQLDLVLTIDEGLPEPITGLLARELGISQPTATDSLLALERKGHVVRARSIEDRRRTVFALTDSGRSIAARARGHHGVLAAQLAELPAGKQGALLDSLLSLIEALVDAGSIDVARTCHSCRFFERGDGESAHCALLQLPLPPPERRVNCAEHALVD